MSLTIQWILVGFVAWFLNLFGVPFVQDELDTFVAASLALASLFGAWYGRYRAGGVSPLGLKE
jgi:hypothetical protein